jgi:aryl-alcohol dehydrogenase-like predicted oxidoreductase
MRYRRLGRTGLKVSEICLGAMTFGETQGFMQGVASDEGESRRVLDRAMDLGVNFIDTADIYGRGLSEEILGRAVKGRRDRLVIATKLRGPMGEGPNDRGLSRARVMAACDASLRRLQTEHIDLYQVHWPDFETPLEETLGALDALVRAGKVRYLGCSNYPAWLLAKALGISERLGLARFDCLQPQYSLLVRDIEREILPLCVSEGVGVIAWSPLASGLLSGKYRRGTTPAPGTRLDTWKDTFRRLDTPASWDVVERVNELANARGVPACQVALQWVLTQRGVTSVIIGARNVAQLEQNVGATSLTLSDVELASLEGVSKLTEGYPEAFLRRIGAIL